MTRNDDWQDYCDICPERKIGVMRIYGIMFCEHCGFREIKHNMKMGEKIRDKFREGRCKFFNICEYKQENGYTCTHEEESSHFCGQYRELDKK